MDKEEREYDKLRMASILTGSFFNPDAARHMVKKENPDFKMTDEEAEEQAKKLHEEIVKEEMAKVESVSKKRRRRRMV